MRRLFFASLVCLALPAFAQHRHLHGEGVLQVAIEQNQLVLELVLPLETAVGFERPPRNEKETAALAAARNALAETDLWQTPPPAQCALAEKSIVIPFAGGDDRHARHAHEGEIYHADIEARYRFVCANPTALNGLSTKLFKSFPRLYRLEATRAGPTGQGKGRLTPKTPSLSW